MALIAARGLSREFRILDRRPGLLGALGDLFRSGGRTVTAVDAIDLDVEAGQFVGYVGPNGAGKSTTIKMLTGILVPTAGTLEVGGLVPWRDRRAHARQIGVVFGQRTQLWWDLPPAEAFRLLGTIYSVAPDRLAANVAYYADRFALGECLETPVRQLSLGQRMRCELTAALLHDPSILFLDEPTIGLDVVAKEEVRTLLSAVHRERGTTILLTSHDLDDIERLCQRVVVIDRGRILHDGTVGQLKALFGNRRRIVFDFLEPVEPDLPAGAHIASIDGHRVAVDFDPAAVRAPAVIGHVLERHAIHDLTVSELEIEEVVRRIYGDA